MNVERRFTYNRTPSLMSLYMEIPQFPVRNTNLRVIQQSRSKSKRIAALQQIISKNQPKATEPRIVRQSINQVLRRGSGPNLEEITPHEVEFRTYLRPVVQTEEQGWNFIYNNMTNEAERIYAIRQQLAVE